MGRELEGNEWEDLVREGLMPEERVYEAPDDVMALLKMDGNDEANEVLQ